MENNNREQNFKHKKGDKYSYFSPFSNSSIYEIMEIDKKADENDIKKAYRKMVLKYHPDRNKDKGAKDKFIKIHSAYEILMNKELRDEYDMMKINDTDKLYNNIKDNIDTILMFFCKDEKYLYNIEKNKYDMAFDYLVKKYIKKERHNILNIVDYIECELMDRYNDNYLYIEITRKSRNNIKLYIPLRNDINIFYGEGEIDDGGNIGDLILYTKTINNKGYYCKNGDMFKEINIDKNAEVINYQHLDGKMINIKRGDLLENDNGNKYIIFNGFGLPKTDDIKRGDLVCEIISL